jgi:hypothetical protein
MHRSAAKSQHYCINNPGYTGPQRKTSEVPAWKSLDSIALNRRPLDTVPPHTLIAAGNLK